ncbi:MAG TPA: hypothetical protein PKW37_05425 [Salinivirgaceae bacterium]|nr:hypothetical protein [Salinivirgaceae bacterium]
MEKLLNLLFVLTFVFGGVASAQQKRSITEHKVKAHTNVNVNMSVGAFRASVEKSTQKQIERKRIKLNSFLDFGTKATTIYSEDFSGGMGEWTVSGLGADCWSVQNDSTAGGTPPELTLKWVSGTELNGLSYCMSPVVNT